MDKLRICLLLLFISLLGLICIWLAGCDDDNPVKSPLVVAADYIAYIYAEDAHEGGVYLSLRTRTSKLDSFVVDSSWKRPSDLDVSADGKRLYMALSDMTAIVDIGTQEVLTELPQTGEVAVSPDNHHIAIQGDDLYILSSEDHSVVWHDSECVTGGCFSADGERFYASDCTRDSLYIYCVDLTCGNVVTTTLIPDSLPIKQVLVSSDEAVWFLYRHVDSDTDNFDVYDTVEDSILFRQVLHPGQGYMTSSHGSRHIYYTDCGSMLPGTLPSYSFAAYDVESRTIDSIVARPSSTGYLGNMFVGGHLAVTPDDRYLVSVHAVFVSTFMVYDLVRDTVNSYKSLYPYRVPLRVACQSGF